MTRHITDSRADQDGASVVPADATAIRVQGTSPRLIQRRHAPLTRQEVESRYVAARDAWTAAMRRANSGRPADLAALALAQETYEAAVAERERWESGARVAIPVEPDISHRGLSAIVQHEMAWRQVRAPEQKPGGIVGRIRRLFRS